MTFVITDFHPSPTGFFSHGDGHHATHHHSHHRHEESAFPPNYQKHTKPSTKNAQQSSCFDCIKEKIKTDPAFVKAVKQCNKDAECVERAITGAIQPGKIPKDVAAKCGDVCSKEEKNPNPSRITYYGNTGGSLSALTSNLASGVGSILANMLI